MSAAAPPPQQPRSPSPLSQHPGALRSSQQAPGETPAAGGFSLALAFCCSVISCPLGHKHSSLWRGRAGTRRYSVRKPISFSLLLTVRRGELGTARARCPLANYSFAGDTRFLAVRPQGKPHGDCSPYIQRGARATCPAVCNLARCRTPRQIRLGSVLQSAAPHAFP